MRKWVCTNVIWFINISMENTHITCKSPPDALNAPVRMEVPHPELRNLTSEHNVFPDSKSSTSLNINGVSSTGKTNMALMICLGVITAIVIYLVIELFKLRKLIQTFESKHVNADDITYLTDELPQSIMNHVSSKLDDYGNVTNQVLTRHMEMIDPSVSESISSPSSTKQTHNNNSMLIYEVDEDIETSVPVVSNKKPKPSESQPDTRLKLSESQPNTRLKPSESQPDTKVKHYNKSSEITDCESVDETHVDKKIANDETDNTSQPNITIVDSEDGTPIRRATRHSRRQEKSKIPGSEADV